MSRDSGNERATASGHHSMGAAKRVSRRRLTRTAPLLAFMVAAAGALWLARAAGNSLWFDELYTVWGSRLPLGQLPGEVSASGHPPLYYLLGHIIFTGDGELQARSISLLAGLTAIVLACLLGRELHSRAAGLWAAALTASSPALMILATEGTDYSLFIAASMAALLFLARGIKNGGRADWVAFVLAALAAMYTHGLGLVFLAAAVPFYLIMDRRPRRRLRPWLVCQAILLVAFAPWSLLMQAGPGPERLPGLVALLAGIGRSPLVILAGPGRLPVIGSSWVLFLVIFLGAVAVMLASGGVRRVAASRESRALASLLLLVVTIPVILALSIVSSGAGQISVRYYSGAIIPLLLLLALALAAAPRRLGASIGALALAAMIYLSVATAAVGTWDYRFLMNTVAEGYQPGDQIICLPVHHCVVAADFYLEGQVPLAGGWINEDGDVLFNATPGKSWSNYTDDDDEVTLTGDGLVERLEDELAGAERVWLVTGDGSDQGYPDSIEVVEALKVGWRQEGSWEMAAPFRLRLFARAGGG